MLYVVWETTSTPDTYYSCSDLVFPAAVAEPEPKPSSAAPVNTKKASPSPAETSAEPAAEKVVETPETADAVLTSAEKPAEDGMVNLGHWLILGALTAAALVIAGAGVSRLRRRRGQ